VSLFRLFLSFFMRYFIEFSYRGTAYFGWQKQPHAPSIQEALEQVLGTLLREPIEVVGSSRTDKGVHARHQMAHFDTSNLLPDPENIVYRMNRMLAKDIAVQRIWEVAPEAHSRFDAQFRRYEYRMSPRKNAFEHDLSYFFDSTLNVESMNEAAQMLFRYSDFQAFSKVHTDVKTFICHIQLAEWIVQSDRLVFVIQANRFLRGMVRAIVGTLLEVGLGRMSVEDFEQIIVSKNRNLAGRSVPARGLYLVEVGYGQ
jgi:tRNA pseudouridine38-40 synthase